MIITKFIVKNVFRHKLRTALTILGLAIAVMAFGLLRTVVTAWNYGVDASSSTRLITRHAVSFIFPLPYNYRDQIAQIPGVKQVSFATWFGGVYKDNAPDAFFPRFAVDPESFFPVYNEFILPDDQLKAFISQRNGCVVGKKIADQFGFKIGDIITMQGDIFPGMWDFVVTGIYSGRDKTVDETQMIIQWAYLDESLKETSPSRVGYVGWYIVAIDKANQAGMVSESIDGLFSNSSAKTKTETEKAFQQGFVSMSSAILASLEIISFVIIGIILLVLGNTMIMSARERIREYAVLKALGFSSALVSGLIIGESVLIGFAGGLIGLALTFPIANAFGQAFPTIFPVFEVMPVTMILSVGFSLGVGLLASAFPAWKSGRTTIVDGLRQIE
ncbi:MAG: ABC transporter permease [Bacteroidetes bacterium]|nr:ABC transporter permease [Bacteroidota bacterium]